jgi:hypothetical protein
VDVSKSKAPSEKAPSSLFSFLPPKETVKLSVMTTRQVPFDVSFLMNQASLDNDGGPFLAQTASQRL